MVIVVVEEVLYNEVSYNEVLSIDQDKGHSIFNSISKVSFDLLHF